MVHAAALGLHGSAAEQLDQHVTLHKQALRSGLNAATPISFTVKANRIRSRGGKLEASASPIRGLDLHVGGAFTDARYRDAVPNLLLSAGSRVLDVPRWTWNARADYAVPRARGFVGDMFAAVRHVGSSDSGFGEGAVLPRPAYAGVDGTVGVRTPGGVEIDLFVTNLFDIVPVLGQEYATSPGNTTATSYFSYLVGPPRTVGVRLRQALR